MNGKDWPRLSQLTQTKGSMTSPTCAHEGNEHQQQHWHDDDTTQTQVWIDRVAHRKYQGHQPPVMHSDDTMTKHDRAHVLVSSTDTSSTYICDAMTNQTGMHT